MGILFKKYKGKFRYYLKPIFSMLAARQKDLEQKDWLDMIAVTKKAVTSNPIEHLGHDLPECDLVDAIVDDLFNEFIKERAFHSATSERILLRKIFGK